MEISFTKMNGAGNDFVVLDNRSGSLKLQSPSITKLCNRHQGVGADGVLAVENAEHGADFRMRYYNADGGEAEMCGNGARCFARFANRLLSKEKEEISFETQAGVISARFFDSLVQVNMSNPHSYRKQEQLKINDRSLEVHSINTGVPHVVVFVDDLEAVDVVKDGSALRYHPSYNPKGTNANFVKTLAPDHIAIRTYERGVENETLACGTGVCASAILYHIRTDAPSPISVTVRGGDTLKVAFQKDKDGNFRSVTLTGPADFVFEGRISL